MKITCNSCQNIITVDDSKAPAGTFRIKCPKCSALITAQKPATESGAATPSASAQMTPEIESYVKREVSELKRELLGAISTLVGGGLRLDENTQSGTATDYSKRALICESDSAFTNQISAVLRNLGYSVDSAGTLAESLKKLESFYSLVTIDSEFPDDKDGGLKIVGRLNGQKPSQRRDTFVVLLSATAKSADATAAFLQGGNLVVNKADVQNLEHLIRDGQRQVQQLYQVFSRMLAERT